ncbi:hypothetical protein LS68_004535 [Helicobacter sp. MIT 05-5293]|uniref:helicase-related protein n=1 Tax=Helicobacter sp. MIT 05-5293 TaxID=1548149 RepID=UPI00051E0A49|nr:helicase-related protein [Helicobacter sp. MIT 05-5293]TLD82262.1 hypothetical protein LS68_004535 [Helicobacter sp. MIT 05-5293]
MQENKGYERLKIRILVGLDVDQTLWDLEQKGLDPAYQDEAFRELFIKHQQAILKGEKTYSNEVDTSIDELLCALRENHLEIKMVKDKNVHAKFYIFASDPKISHTQSGCQRYNGSLIVGSSNLSHNGLEKNYEFNLMSNESDDIAFALSEFERLWSDSVPIESAHIDTCVKTSYLQILPPKDIYYKLLLCHFGEDSLKIDDSIKGIFKHYTPYDYQVSAVQEGIEKLKKYNGFFLSDVVGLGKTLIASVIAQKCHLEGFITGKILVCTPPSLKKSWKKHFDDIGIANYDITTHDSIHKITRPECIDIELVIIDESHNFRSGKGKRYNELERLCRTPYQGKSKKVILLSATPQNNAPSDIYHQISLFLPKRHHGIEGIIDLERFCSERQKKFEEIKKELKDLQEQKNVALQSSDQHKQKDIEEQLKAQTQKLKENSDSLRDKLLSHIMTRRTRKDIETLYRDKEKQNLRFPTIQDPQDLRYELDSSSLPLAQDTIAFLAQEPNAIGSFAYKRYLIFPNLTDEGKQAFIAAYNENESNQDQKESFYQDTAERLQVLIQKILFKRFDSSIEAFKSTLKKQITSHNALLKMFFEKDKIHIPKHYDSREKLYEAVLSDNDSDLEKFLDKDKVFPLEKHHFKSDFVAALKQDKQALEKLLHLWEEVDSDPKLERLEIFLREHPKDKIVLFTEAKTTAQYLAQRLKGEKILQIDASNREDKEQIIRENFDANYKKELQKDDYRIIIATDTLSEGVNLHRADIIINYDTPYNATRLMQRIGRINRIGTSFDKIYIYNFKPTNLADRIININAIASSKLQSFHYTLGEDSAIYDDEEEVGSKKIFISLESKEEQSKDTLYKKDLKDLYEQDKEEFARIKSLPLKSRSLILSPSITESQSFAYIKTGQNRDSFAPYHINTPSETLLKEPDAQSCDFYEMADFLKAHLNDPITKSSQNRDVHYHHINAALVSYKNALIQESRTDFNAPLQSKLTADENNATAKVKNCQGLDDTTKQKLISAIERGDKNLCKHIKNAQRENLTDTLYALARNLPELDSTSHTQGKESSPSDTQQPQIQISLTAFPIETTRTQKDS